VKGESTVDELVKLVAQKTGISDAMAKQAVEIVLGFIKEKLPAPIAGQIDAVIGGGDSTGGLGGILGGIMGGS
jgi:hypothetical protein